MEGPEGGAGAREGLILRHLPIVRGIASAYRRRGEYAGHSVEDLWSAGVVGLIYAIDTFNPDRGVELEDAIGVQVRYHILRCLRDLDGLIHVPLRRRMQGLSISIYEMRDSDVPCSPIRALEDSVVDRACIEWGLSKLSYAQSKVLREHFLDGKPLSTLAKEIGISYTAVYTCKYRGLLRMRNLVPE